MRAALEPCSLHTMQIVSNSHLVAESPLAISSLYRHRNYFHAATRPVERSINHSWAFRNWWPGNTATQIVYQGRGGHSETADLSECSLKSFPRLTTMKKNPKLFVGMRCHIYCKFKSIPWRRKGFSFKLKYVHDGTAEPQKGNLGWKYKFF